MMINPLIALMFSNQTFFFFFFLNWLFAYSCNSQYFHLRCQLSLTADSQWRIEKPWWHDWPEKTQVNKLKHNLTS